MNILVPEKIDDITLNEFQRFDAVNKDNSDSDFLLFKTIEIFCGVDISIVSKFPLKDAEDISREVNNVLLQESPFKERFTMDGIEYGFIPDLSGMSLGEYIDLEEGLKETASFHKAAAVMYRPVVKSFKNLYTVESYDASTERHESMKNAPLGIISAAVVFFYSIVNELLEVSLHYSETELSKKMTTLEKLNSGLSMDGFLASTNYQGGQLQTIKK